MRTQLLLRVATICLTLSLLAPGARAAGGVPAFEIAAPNGRTSVLIGTIHVPYFALRQSGPRVFEGAY